MKKLQIENLNQYVDALHACDFEVFTYEEVAQSANVHLTDIQHLIKWNPDHYSRITIEKTKNFELILLCWAPGQESQIHNHNGEEGWMKVIQGQLTEDVFSIEEVNQPPKLSRRQFLTPNNTYYINDRIGVHKIANHSNEKCISLHLYTHPVESCSIYDEITGATTVLDLVTESK